MLKLSAILLGLLAAIAVVVPMRPHTGIPRGDILSDCDGQIRTIAINYVAGADFAADVYHSFLPQLPADVRVLVICPDENVFAELRTRVGPIAAELEPVIVNHPMTPWSRDRWVTLRRNPGAVLLLSSSEEGSEIWPQRKGDEQLAADLAVRDGSPWLVRPSGLFFDGGDFVDDDRTAFIAPGVIRRNLHRTVAGEAELIERLSTLVGRRIVLLPDAPDHHAGMFMMAAGDNTILVADPSLARDLPHLPLPGGADFSPETQARYDSVAAAATADGKTFLTYLNVIIDQRAGRRIVCMPVFDGCDALNSAAREVWQGLGYEVRRVNCTNSFRQFGNLRCLVNVLERS
ncbi:MAG: hypothetical protein ABSH20_06280 [Tepidisphaeraceae bacterium]